MFAVVLLLLIALSVLGGSIKYSEPFYEEVEEQEQYPSSGAAGDMGQDMGGNSNMGDMGTSGVGMGGMGDTTMDPVSGGPVMDVLPTEDEDQGPSMEAPAVIETQDTVEAFEAYDHMAASPAPV
jgi:hypothetical protein